MGVPKDILDLVSAVQGKGEAVAVATIVRGAPSSAARAGARAVIAVDGTISGDWIDDAAREALLAAAREALADGRPRLLHLPAIPAWPPHSRRQRLDVLVEPMLPRPVLALFGASPVALALSDLARRMGFFVAVCAPAVDQAAFGEADRLIEGDAPPPDLGVDAYFVIATQGADDSAALAAALALPARYVAFVGSRKRIARLKSDLARGGVAAAKLDQIRAHAGLDIGAVTPDEIALSILAEMIAIRRRGQRNPS
jgi:xanthine dehydrogenase accessory factor